MKKNALLIAPFFLFSCSSSDDDKTQCPEVESVAIELTLFDSKNKNKLNICDAIVTFTHNNETVTLIGAEEVNCNLKSSFNIGDSVGSYDLTIEKVGYQVMQIDSVIVNEDSCGTVTTLIDSDLEK